MNLLEQSLWWLVPLFVLALLIVYSMMEFTAALIAKRPRRQVRTSPAELRAALLALNDPGKPWRLVEGGKADLEILWDVVDKTWFEVFARVKLSAVYRARMLVDTTRQEIRWFEILRIGSFFLGFAGLTPRFSGDFRVQSGYVDIIWRGSAYGILPGFPPRIGRILDFELNTVEVKRTVAQTITDVGWTFRPVTLPWQASRRWIDLTCSLAPEWLLALPRRRAWGVLYVGSFATFFAYVFFGISDPATDWTSVNFAVAGVVASLWWATWGALTWLLLGLPGLKRKRRK